MITWCVAVLVVVCFGKDAGGELHNKYPDFPPESNHDLFPDVPELNSLLDSGFTYFVPGLSPVFLPPLARSDDKDKEVQTVQKRISRLVLDPHSKRWSEVFRVSPKVFRELRNSGQRIRPLFRKDPGFKMSGYGPARKRPYYYTEPEGSEFLGGPGK